MELLIISILLIVMSSMVDATAIEFDFRADLDNDCSPSGSGSTEKFQELFKAEDPSLFLKEVAKGRGYQHPSFQELRTMFEELKEGSTPTYIKKNDFTLLRRKYGSYTFSYGNDGTFETIQYVKRELSGEKRRFRTLTFHFNLGNTTRFAYNEGHVFYDNVRYNQFHNRFSWEGETTGVFITEGTPNPFFGNYSSTLEGLAYCTNGSTLDIIGGGQSITNMHVMNSRNLNSMKGKITPGNTNIKYDSKSVTGSFDSYITIDTETLKLLVESPTKPPIIKNEDKLQSVIANLQPRISTKTSNRGLEICPDCNWIWESETTKRGIFTSANNNMEILYSQIFENFDYDLKDPCNIKTFEAQFIAHNALWV